MNIILLLGSSGERVVLGSQQLSKHQSIDPFRNRLPSYVDVIRHYPSTRRPSEQNRPLVVLLIRGRLWRGRLELRSQPGLWLGADPGLPEAARLQRVTSRTLLNIYILYIHIYIPTFCFTRQQ